MKLNRIGILGFCYKDSFFQLALREIHLVRTALTSWPHFPIEDTKRPHSQYPEDRRHTWWDDLMYSSPDVLYNTTPFLGRLLPSPPEYGPWAHSLRRPTGITSSQHLTTVTCQQAWGVRVKIDRLLVWTEHSYRRPKKETRNLGRELLRKPLLKISELTEPPPKFTKGSATNNKLLNRLERPHLSKKHVVESTSICRKNCNRRRVCRASPPFLSSSSEMHHDH